MITIQTTRPRNVNALRAAAMLYGDLGTSKAYVIGIAFALAAYSSFWFVLGISILTLLVGINYITICRLYPNGGGVYASVRNRSKVLALIGAFFLVADYIVTAALSALSAFHYLNVPYPELMAIIAIAVIGILNFFGPKHTGSLAIGLAIPTLCIVLALSAFAVPYLPEAIQHLTPISSNFLKDWGIFVGIVVALSGIESIANTTGSMQLDPGSTSENPSVVKTAKPAILMVIAEVCIITALLGLAVNAIPGLEINGDDVNAPGFPNVRDALLRYMGENFASGLLGKTVGYIFGIVISIVIAMLLLSAVNTAIVALISLLFVMSCDLEIPAIFQRLNRFGVPFYANIVAFILPITILLFVHDMIALASLYAIGFVGAIAVNLGSTSTNYKLNLTSWQRYFMLATFLIMALIELTLFIDKPHARIFVVTVMALGLILRMLVQEQKEKATDAETLTETQNLTHGLLVAVSDIDKSLDFAMEESKTHHLPLNVLFIRERKVLPGYTQQTIWSNDKKAVEVYNYVKSKFDPNPLAFFYTVTANPAHSICEIAYQRKVKRVILSKKRGNYLIHFLKENTIRELSKTLSKKIDLIVLS